MVDDRDVTKEFVMRWVERAQVDYYDLYIRLYIAYNAWYRRVTGMKTDREAMIKLKKRFVIWDDYCHGRALHELTPIAARILDDPYDWRGLITYWYAVRCDVIHGVSSIQYEQYKKRIVLAYLSLNTFMLEVTGRMARSFTDADHNRLRELDALVAIDETFRKARDDLYQKYIESPDLWNVDMERV